jgi:sulfonate transport system permease protein
MTSVPASILDMGSRFDRESVPSHRAEVPAKAAQPEQREGLLRLRRGALALPFPLLILALWALAAAQEWIPPQILPAPQTVLETLRDLFDSGELVSNTLISLNRVLLGFGLGGALGLLLGVSMGLSPVIKDYLYPSFKAFAQIPALGWLPLLMMLVGIDEALKIILIAKASMVPIALNTYQGFRDVPNRVIDVARAFRFGRWQLLSRVVFPAAFPQIWTGVRYGLTHAWLALVVVELLASSEGIGFLIVYGRQLYQLDVVLAAVVVVGLIGYLLDKVLALIESRLLRWRREAF